MSLVGELGVAGYFNKWGYVALHAHRCLMSPVYEDTSLIDATHITVTNEAIVCQRRVSRG